MLNLYEWYYFITLNGLCIWCDGWLVPSSFMPGRILSFSGAPNHASTKNGRARALAPKIATRCARATPAYLLLNNVF